MVAQHWPDFLTSEYGINLVGDLVALVFFLVVFTFMGGRKSAIARSWLHVMLVFSALGSIPVVTEAIGQDAGVLLYHAFWVLVGIVSTLRLRVEYRSYKRARKASPQQPIFSSTKEQVKNKAEKVYVITTLPE